MLHVCHRAKHPQSGDCIWDDVRRIELDDASEINWTHIECGENYERCRHCVWFHFPDLRGTAVERLGTAKFLGREPMQRHDAIAYILNGIRYHATGCGFRGGYARPANIPAALRRFNHDSRYWFEDVIGPDGTHRHPGLRLGRKSERPCCGVTWIFPPTFANPRETTFS